MQDRKRYSLVMKILHWGMALAFVGLYAVAYIMQDMNNSPEKFQLYGLHKSVGITILVLVLIRFFYRIVHGVPAISKNLSPLWNLAARLGHYSLYLLMVLMPLSGYLMSSAGGHSVSYFGFFQVPLLLQKNPALGGFFHESHEILSYVIYGLVTVHVIMALVHHFILKDDTLTRMTWGNKNRF